MSKTLKFLLCFLAGGFFVFILTLVKNGAGNNSGSEFYGSEFIGLQKNSGRGLGNNSGSKFYGDLYIKEKFKNGSV